MKKLDIYNSILLILANVLGSVWLRVIYDTNYSTYNYTRTVSERIIVIYYISVSTTLFFILLGWLLYYSAPIRNFFKNKNLEQIEASDIVKRRTINYPIVIAFVVIGGWAITSFLDISGFAFFYNYNNPIEKINIILINVVKVTLTSILCFCMSYFISDFLTRIFLIPKVFPNGGLINVERTIKIPMIQKYVMYFYSVGIYPVILISYIIYVFDAQKHTLTNILFLTGSFIVVGIFLTILMLISIQTEVELLKKATEKIIKSDFEIVVPERGIDELGMLSYSMNKMAESIKNHTTENEKISKQLRELNKNLEQKVEEKSAELVAAKEELMFSEKISSVGKFAAGIAHEINSPLVGILTNICVLEEEIDELDISKIEEFKESAKEYAELIKLSTKKSRDIIIRLMKYTEKMEKKPNNLKLGELIKDYIKKNKESIVSQNIKLLCEIYEDIEIKAIESEITEVIHQLIENAIHALNMKDSDEKYIKISDLIVNGRYIITIEDNGIGIPEKNITNLFQPFFTTKSIGEGMGLGLSYCYSVMKKIKGEIKISSKESIGTRLELIF